jgi:hypothetical protein
MKFYLILVLKAVIIVPSVMIDKHNTIIIMEQTMARHCRRPGRVT